MEDDNTRAEARQRCSFMRFFWNFQGFLGEGLWQSTIFANLYANILIPSADSGIFEAAF